MDFTRGKRTAYERDASIADVFAMQAERVPHATAVEFEGGRYTYAELDARSERCARELRRAGALPGARIGVALGRSPRTPEVLLGILKTGGAYVALDPSDPPERIARTMRDAAVGIVVVEPGSPVSPATFGDAAVVESPNEPLGPAPARPPRATVAATDLAYVAYTSGSTGTPKGVAVTQRGVVRLVRGADYFEVARDDVFFHYAPLGFDASTFEIWAPLLNGARLAIPPPGPLSLAELGANLRRFAVTTLWLTAPLFRLMVENEPASLAGLRQLITGGDVVPVEAATRFLAAYPRCALIDGYGPTENTTFSCAYRIASAADIRAGVPIGRPIANSTAYVVDDDLRPAELGHAGELCVGGDGLARGYLNLSALSAERFVPDPFSDEPGARMYRTGDLARFRADGNLEFLGRSDEQVKIRGFRVEPGEIESVLRTHPQVDDAAVAVFELAGEKALRAFVAGAPHATLEARHLRAYLRSRLPAHMLPSEIAVVEAIPTLPSGKIDRRRLTAR